MRSSVSEKGRERVQASCARRTFAAATSRMAEVIFCVFLTEPTRSRSSLMDTMAGCGVRGVETMGVDTTLGVVGVRAMATSACADAASASVSVNVFMSSVRCTRLPTRTDDEREKLCEFDSSSESRCWEGSISPVVQLVSFSGSSVSR